MEFKDINQDFLKSLAKDYLFFSDGGEIFLENVQSELFVMDNGSLSNTDYKIKAGFGFRSFCGEYLSFVHSSDVSKKKLLEAANIVKSPFKSSSSRYIALSSSREDYYLPDNPLSDSSFSFEKKVELLSEINQYIKNKCSDVVQTTIMLMGNHQEIMVVDQDGFVHTDIRPMVRLNVSIVIGGKNNHFENGYEGFGGRSTYNKIFSSWKDVADRAIRRAEVNLESVPAPSGEMQVVLASGWPGIILHEAIGHGLEGDFNRKKTSVFSDLMGKTIASPQVTVVDDGTISGARGSISIDDEGTPSSKTLLIENGTLVGYMYDKMNANLMGKHSTGNGRRESYLHLPFPRMTNTYMLPGVHTPDEIVASVKKGIYAVSFSGGQVDITSGKFIFSTSEAYLIENGKVTVPLKGVTLIGSGDKILKEIDMVANDWSLDSGTGTCSKNGQNVPVGVGQPTIRIASVTVGGSNG